MHFLKSSLILKIRWLQSSSNKGINPIKGGYMEIVYIDLEALEAEAESHNAGLSSAG